MAYVALYRKARPQTFDEVRGQEHITETIKNQIRAGRPQHAYLFCGTRGTGKTSIAKIIARAVNCESSVDGNPCNTCETCSNISKGVSMNVIEIDAASNNGVDNIREIIEEVRYRPTEGKYKVYIIDEVHMLSTGAFNALLKTLEEPPEYVIFILATTEAAKIPQTILSRCQRYDFKRIGIGTLMDQMRKLMDKEGLVCEEKALRFIARQADGSMRDALSLLDLCTAFHKGDTLTYEEALDAIGAVDTDIYSQMLTHIRTGDAGGCIQLFTGMVERGKEAGQFVSDFIWYLRNLLIVGTSNNASDLVDASEEQMHAYAEHASHLQPEVVMRYIRIMSELQSALRHAVNRRVQTEVSLIKLCRPQMETTSDAAFDRIRQLEAQMMELLTGTVPQKTEQPWVNWGATVEKLPSADKYILSRAILSCDSDSVSVKISSEFDRTEVERIVTSVTHRKVTKVSQ